MLLGVYKEENESYLYFNKPAFETVMMNGPDVSFTGAGLDHRTGIRGIAIVANPAFRFLVPVFI